MAESTIPLNNPVEDADDTSGEPSVPKEIGGRKGLDPTRYGDWEIGGKCVDF